jgi:hypothetical protein
MNLDCYIPNSGSSWTDRCLNSEQWEFQVGPSVGISAGDQLWAARYILEVKAASLC